MADEWLPGLIPEDADQLLDRVAARLESFTDVAGDRAYNDLIADVEACRGLAVILRTRATRRAAHIAAVQKMIEGDS